MGAIEWGEHGRRLQKATGRLDTTVQQLYSKICPTDATELDATGTCRVCGLNPKLLEQRRESEREAQRRKDDEDDELHAQTEKEKQFWSRLAKQRHEREAEALRERQHGELLARGKLAGEDRATDHVPGDLGLRPVRLHGGRVGESAAADAAARGLRRAGQGVGFCHLIFDVI